MKEITNRILRKISLVILITILIFSISACGGKIKRAGNKDKPRSVLVLATTTSLQDSGLLDELIPAFERRYPYKVKALALGTGEALATGRRGEADVLLVHSVKDELEFIAEGFGKNRRSIAYNYFIIAGPKSDPAAVKSARSAADAFRRIARSKTPFISRGDQSGTHKKELSLWKQAGVKPSGDSYIQAGQGMGETLQLADDRQAYTLTDTATFLSMRNNLALWPLMAENVSLVNIYSVIEVNAAKFKNIEINSNGAADFSRFLQSAAAKQIIRNFGRKKYGRPLFYLIVGKGTGNDYLPGL